MELDVVRAIIHTRGDPGVLTRPVTDTQNAQTLVNPLSIVTASHNLWYFFITTQLDFHDQLFEFYHLFLQNSV